ncbi:hypothetical protein GCM10027261_13530 [Geodermatophilus arenarius]
MRGRFAGDTVPRDEPPGPPPGRRHETSKGTFEMLLWPAVTLVGFLVLTALVIAMGTSTTARYEREQRAAARRETAQAGATVEAVGMARAA